MGSLAGLFRQGNLSNQEGVPDMRTDERNLLIMIMMFAAATLAFLLLAMVTFASARDLGQWENADPKIVEWYQSLMQPDNPAASCCSESDGYYADEVHVRDGKVFARITDDRPDEPRHRPHREIGEEFEIPPYKMNKDANPTGHRVIFLSRGGYVYCFVDGGGS